MAAEAYSSTYKVKKLEYDLAALKGSNISAFTSLQLETARQEIVDLKTRLDTIQVKYESSEKKIERYIPQIQDLERSISEFCFTAYAKDEELITAYNQVIHFKKIVDRLEPQVLELQGALKINENLKKEIKELGYVDHLFGRPSDFEFSSKDFETFSISMEDLLVFTFEYSIGEVVREVVPMPQLRVKRQMVLLLKASRQLKVWRPSSRGISKLLKSSLLARLYDFLYFSFLLLLCLISFGLC